MKDGFNNNDEHKNKFIQSKKNDRRKTYIAMTILWITFFAVSVISFFGLYFGNKTRMINAIVVSGYKHTTPTEIILALNPLLNTKYLGTIPVNNYVFFSRDLAEKYLITSYPGISEAAFEFKGNTLHINLKEKSINSLICNVQTRGNIDEQCYFLDHFSKPYSIAPRISKGLYKKFYVAENQFKEYASSKKPIFTLEEFQNLGAALIELEYNNNIIVDTIVLDKEKLSMDFYIYRMKDWYPENLVIKFSFATLDATQRSVTLLGIKSFINKIIMPDGDISHMYDLEYIDCRFIEKVLYKKRTYLEPEEIKI